MFKDFENRIKDKRYQELSKPYRIVLWLRWIPIGYIKGLGWYFVKRLKWEDVCADDDDDCGRITLGTCIGICVGTMQGDMRWYYKSEEIFTDNGELIRRVDKKGFLERIFVFLEDKIIEIIDGKTIYD